MRKFGVRAVLSIAAFCVLSLLSPLSAYADSVTLTLSSLSAEHSGSGGGAAYVYPYYFTVADGSKTTTNVSLMCIDYDADIYVNESWTASTEKLSASSSLTNKEAAYIFSQLGTYTAAEVNWAEWKLFEDPNSKYAGELTSAIGTLSSEEQLAIASLLSDAADYVSLYSDSDLYSGFVIYTASDSTIYQNVMGYASAPEPNSLMLLGSGLSLAAVFFYYRKRKGLNSITAGTALK